MMNNQDTPERFGDYYLIDRIAVGGMAEIWRAKTVGLEGFERNVAIKCILPSFTQNPEFNSMFIDEARIASTLTHSNIVRITNFGVIDNKYYHEMEFVDGRNLRQILQKCKEEHVSFPIDSACYIVSEICKGLHYAHTKHDSVTNEPLNIIHRDMSPQNIMISYEGEIKIIDWGIAKAKGKIEETRAGVLKGKFGYMSPEQAEGEELDLRSDIFSVGIILYELVTGERLFVADSEVNTLKKIKEGVIPLPSRVNPDVDKELEVIVLRALARPRIERYQTCYDLYDDLVKYLHKKFPAYNSLKLSKFIKETFSNEIIADRKRIHGKEQSVPSYSAMSYSGKISGDKTRISGHTGNESAPEGSSSPDSGEIDRTLLTDSSPASESEFGVHEKEEATVTVEASDKSSKYDAEDEDYDYRLPFTKRFLKPKTIITVIIMLGIIAYLAFSGGKKKQSVHTVTQLPPVQQMAQQQPTPQQPAPQKPVQQQIPQEQVQQPPVEQQKPVEQQQPVNKQQQQQTQQPTENAKTASLSLASTPVYANVIIDGVNRGKTPVTLKDLSVGKRYELALSADGFETVTKYFTLRKENNNLVIPLTPVQGTGLSYLSLEVEPPVLIYIDGRLASTYKSIYMHRVDPGIHEVRFINEKMKIDYKMSIPVGKGEQVKKNITLR
ncbi:MAG: serine/threonine protein kinase [Proteobacteria bacterium]|nr:serine/threonine protein kinase [Pseudomonadota bacterium]